MSVAEKITSQKQLLEDLIRLDVEVMLGDLEVCLASLKLQLTLHSQIKEAQLISDEGRRVLKTIYRTKSTELIIEEDGVVKHDKRLWVPNESNLRKETIKEAHSLTYSTHPESTKMYKD